MAQTSIVDRARALTPLIRGHRAESEASFRMDDSIAGAMGDAGLLSLAVPRDYGGTEASFPEEIAVLEELAFADPSMAWVAVNSNGAAELVSRLAPDRARAVLGTCRHVFGVGLAPVGRIVPAEGGYRVEGRWPVVSGCLNAAWFVMASLLYDEAGKDPVRANNLPVVRWAVLPREAAVIDETWTDVVAVQGSGSHAVEIAPTFVENSMTFSFTDPVPFDRPRYRNGGGSGRLTHAAIGIGIARAAVDAAREQATERSSVVSGTGWRDWPSVQDSMAAVDAEVFAAGAGLREIAEAVWDFAVRGVPIPDEWRARQHAMSDYGTRLSREATSRLFSVGSVDALHKGHGLERALRDAHGFSVQWERYRRQHFEAGRVLLGGEPKDPAF